MANKFPKVVTLRWLMREGACIGSLELFSELFPKGVRLSIASLKRFEREAEKLSTEWQPDRGFNWVKWFYVSLVWAHPGARKLARTEYGRHNRWAKFRELGVPEK